MRGISNTFKRRKIFREIHEQKSDITFLQETHSSKAKIKQWKAEWGGKSYLITVLQLQDVHAF